MIAAPGTLRVGTLGSKATFAGEATEQLRERYPELGEAVYFPTIPDCWEELAKGSVDVVVLSVERTGLAHHHGDAVLAHGFYVMTDITVPLRCNLFAKPGTRKADIRRITGHGSIVQCTTYLDREFPGIPREPHPQNSVEAAKAVVAGDGSLAVVGAPSLPAVVPGLELFAPAIDDGAICKWWAVTARPFFSDHPSVVVVAARSPQERNVAAAVDAVQATGFRLTTTGTYPAPGDPARKDSLLVFAGSGARTEVERALASLAGTRLIGAFVPR